MKNIFKKKKKFGSILIILVLFIGLLSSYIYYRNIKSEEERSQQASVIANEVKNSDGTEQSEETSEILVEQMEPSEEIPVETIDEPATNVLPQENITPTEPTIVEPTEPPPTNWWSYPSQIVEIPVDQVTLNVLMNKSRKLSAAYVPPDLIQLQSMPGIRVTKTLYVRSIIVEPLRQLGAAAQSEGLDLSIISAYRSYGTQQSTYQYWVNYNGGNVNAADQVSARPGHSEHQLGTTVDFSTSEIGDAIGAQFNSTKANIWLLNNASMFGFKLSYPAGQESVTGFAHEGWHWRYNP